MTFITIYPAIMFRPILSTVLWCWCVWHWSHWRLLVCVRVQKLIKWNLWNSHKFLKISAIGDFNAQISCTRDKSWAVKAQDTWQTMERDSLMYVQQTRSRMDVASSERRRQTSGLGAQIESWQVMQHGAMAVHVLAAAWLCDRTA